MTWIRPYQLSIVCVLWGTFLGAWADPIAVRHVQGSARGFLALKNPDGQTIAYGDLVQTPHGNLVTSHLTFHFRDGSLDDDTTVYSQQRVFRLISDHHIQKGPSFPKPIDVTVDASTGMVTSRSTGQDGKEKIETQHLDMPPEISNGMTSTLISNLPFSAPQTRLAYVTSSTSKSRLVHLAISPMGLEPLIVGGSHRKAMNFIVRVQLGGVAGVIAPIIGKQPDDLHVWVLGGEVPVVVAEEGQLYSGGPVWRVELISPSWPSRSHKDNRETQSRLK